MVREQADRDKEALQERLVQRMERQIEQIEQLVRDKAVMQEAVARERAEDRRRREKDKVEERVRRERWEEDKRREIK